VEVPALGLGVVDEVQPAHNIASATERTTAQLATPIFFISTPSLLRYRNKP